MRVGVCAVQSVEPNRRVNTAQHQELSVSPEFRVSSRLAHVSVHPPALPLMQVSQLSRDFF
eukprot:5443733-Prymnesium_polylepis.1